MKGKKYILITSIIIIVGALAGLAINLFTRYFPTYWHVSRLICVGICGLLLVTGILGITNRGRSSLACKIFGFLLFILSLFSLPFMFWTGNGSAPVSELVCGFIGLIIIGLYLFGVFLNREKKTREYRYDML